MFCLILERGSIIKLAKSYKEQIDILKSRGLIIDDVEKAIKYLSNNNYYNFTGYLIKFKENINGEEKYKDEICFKDICNIIEFDKKLKNILFFALMELEQSLKTKFAHCLGIEYKALGYKDVNNFKCENYNDAKNRQIEVKHNKFISILNENLRKNNDKLFVRHHNDKYNGEFPIWVAVDLFTMGMLKNLYEICNNDIKRKISKEYGVYYKNNYKTGEPEKKFGVDKETFGNWLSCIVILRNTVAHNGRLSDFKGKHTPAVSHNYKNNTSGENKSAKLFYYIEIMKILYPYDDSWNKEVYNRIVEICENHSDYIDLKELGFPDDWKNKLKK